MTKELIEIRTGQGLYVNQSFMDAKIPVEAKFFIVEPILNDYKPRVRVYDEDESFIEEFEGWSEMTSVFRRRHWEIVDSTVWDDSDTLQWSHSRPSSKTVGRNRLAKSVSKGL